MKLLKEDIVGLKALLPKETITQLGNKNEGLSAELASLLETPITDIDLPVRAANTLIHMGIKKFADIPQIDSDTRVLKERNSGKKTVHDISRMLESFYLTFGMSYTEIVNVLSVKDWHIAKKKWIKECEHKESTKKLDDKDNTTIGEIKDKTIIVPKDAQINSYDQSYSVSKPSSWKSDRTKYSEDNEWLNKRRFVLETVKAYVRLHPHISYDSLIRIFPASLNYNKANGVILRYDDVTKKLTFNPRTQNYFFLKDDEIVELSDGTKVVVHSQWGTDFDNFLKVAERLFHVKTKGDRYKLDALVEKVKGIDSITGEPELKEDKRIGYVVRLFPSQLKGEIIRVRKDTKGVKKIIVKTKDYLIEIDDLPYLYEVLKRK